MTRSQEIGRRYLAGFAIIAAGIYLAVTCASSAIAWPETDPLWLCTNLLAFGLVPSFAALALGNKAWFARPAASAAMSGGALVILLIALAIWQTYVISF